MTWTTQGSFSIGTPTANYGLQVYGATNSYTAKIVGNSTSPYSFGLVIEAGTTSADSAFAVNNQANTANYFLVRGDGAIQGLGPVAAALVDMTPDTGTFTITYTGLSGTVTGTASWVRIGKLVMLTLPAGSGTSNAMSFTATGLPSAIQPTTANTMGALPGNVCQNSGAYVNCAYTVNAGTMTFYNGASESGTSWTASGTKGFLNAAFAVYSLL